MRLSKLAQAIQHALYVPADVSLAIHIARWKMLGQFSEA